MDFPIQTYQTILAGKLKLLVYNLVGMTAIPSPTYK